MKTEAIFSGNFIGDDDYIVGDDVDLCLNK